MAKQRLPGQLVSYKIRPPKNKPKILMQRSFGTIDVGKLRDDAGDIDWSPVLNAKSIDDKVTVFNEKLIQLYDVHAPLRAIKIKHLPAPWLTDDIKSYYIRKR